MARGAFPNKFYSHEIRFWQGQESLGKLTAPQRQFLPLYAVDLPLQVCMFPHASTTSVSSLPALNTRKQCKEIHGKGPRANGVQKDLKEIGLKWESIEEEQRSAPVMDSVMEYRGNRNT